MPEQRELPLFFPELSPERPLIPVHMVNEFVYCPRLAYLEWEFEAPIQGPLALGLACHFGLELFMPGG